MGIWRSVGPRGTAAAGLLRRARGRGTSPGSGEWHRRAFRRRGGGRGWTRPSARARTERRRGRSSLSKGRRWRGPERWSWRVDSGGFGGEAAGMSASGERLDDAHATAAARTGPPCLASSAGCRGGRGAACVGFGARPSGRVGGRDQVPQAPDGCGASGTGEEAVVADAVEAARQHVQEEAADELAGRRASSS